MKKKLLFIITKSNWGGAQKYVFELIEHLYNNPEYEVHLCVGGDGEMVQRLQEIGFKNINNLKYMSNSINPFKLILSTAELSKYIYKISPDIIHINSSFALITSVKSIYLIKIINLLRLNNYTPKIIFTAHG
ncbi:MAG: hypothetical protein QM532_01545 [Cyanobium sp. MAG06]|nr:hypothetical protein [Cyanobium sp. MAG06]